MSKSVYKLANLRLLVLVPTPPERVRGHDSIDPLELASVRAWVDATHRREIAAAVQLGEVEDKPLPCCLAPHRLTATVMREVKTGNCCGYGMAASTTSRCLAGRGKASPRRSRHDDSKLPRTDGEVGGQNTYTHLFRFVVLSSVLRVVPTAAGGAYLAYGP